MSILGALTGSDAAKAAKKAAALQAAAADRATEVVRDQIKVTRNDLAPTIGTGNDARDQQSALLGLGGKENQQKAVDSILESPAQQFIRKRAQRNLLQNSAAIGGIGGGNVRSALVEQGAGFAAQDVGNQFNRLNALSGQGANAATNLGQFSQNAAQGIAGGINRAAEARGSGILGAAQARAQGVGNIAKIASSAFLGPVGAKAIAAASSSGAI